MVDENGQHVGVVTLEAAQKYAKERELDLVEIVPDADTPVCRIMDVKKFQYEEKKKLSESRRKQKQHRVELKEMKYRPEIEQADYQVKLRKIVQFLSEGHKVKITLRFRGREMSHQEVGLALLQRLETDLGEDILIEQRPKLEGRQMIMLISPKRKK